MNILILSSVICIYKILMLSVVWIVVITSSVYLKEKKLFIKRGVIPRFFDEIYQYKWKPNSTKDEPLKEFDDVLDALRYAIYSKIMGIGSRIKVFKGGFWWR